MIPAFRAFLKRHDKTTVTKMLRWVPRESTVGPKERVFLNFQAETRFPSLCLIQPAGAAFVPISEIWRILESSLCSETSYCCGTRWPWGPDHCNWPNQKIQRLYRSGSLLISIYVFHKCHNAFVALSLKDPEVSSLLWCSCSLWFFQY